MSLTAEQVNEQIEAIAARIQAAMRDRHRGEEAVNPKAERDAAFNRRLTRARAAGVPSCDDVFPFVVADDDSITATESVRVSTQAVREWEAFRRTRGCRRGRIAILSAQAGRGKTIGICRGPVVASESGFAYLDSRRMADLGREALARLREVEILSIDEMGWSRAIDERARDLMLQRYDEGLLTICAGIVTPHASPWLLNDPTLSRLERQDRRGWPWAYPSDGHKSQRVGDLLGPDLRDR